jgi:uncharacterized membrane protein
MKHLSSGHGAAKTTLGFDERFEGLLAYSLGWVSGILILLFEKKSRFVRFHALQSISTFLLLFLLMQVPFLGALFAPLIVAATFFLWIVLMYQAYHGHAYRLPLVGELAAKELEIFE